MAPKYDVIPFQEHFLQRVGVYSSSLLFRPKRPLQLRRRVALPTGSASAGSGFEAGAGFDAEAGAGFDSALGSAADDFLSGGGFGADRPLLVPLLVDELVPPTRRRVGVRRILESLAESFAASSCSGAAVALDDLRTAGLRVRVVAVRRVFVPAADVAVLRVLDRREVAALVAALSSPLGEAASSETSGREEAADRDRA